MIDWLSIRHFAIAAAVDVELEQGFTAITGETGSGKSLMVDALAVLLGARADNSLIQHGQAEAEVRCGFSLPATHPVFTLLAERELTTENELILRRIMRRDKSSRGYVNGNPVNISVLRELGELLVDIHGQHEHHSLMRRPVQQALLDQAAGNDDMLQELAARHEQISALKQQLQQVSGEQSATLERMDLLKFQLEELHQLAPASGEWEQLEQSQKRFSHARELLVGCQSVATTLYQDDDSLHDTLVRLTAQLRQLEKFDSDIGSIAQMLEEAGVNIEEAGAQLRDYCESGDLDPAEQESVEQRLSSWHELARKHRVQPGVLDQHMTAMELELANLRNPEEERERLDALLSESIETYRGIATRLTQNRTMHATRLSREITSAMQKLGMQGGQLAIELQPLQQGKISRLGLETVEFQVSANAGQPLQPLSKVASGGEVSRISLAIQVILADAASVPTLVFDEVDVGIGGTVANVVGERLRQLGKACQVLCVTHLPQVAARATQHLTVSKSERDGVVDVTLEALDDESRIAEIARMGGSEKLTREARAHAEEMLSANNAATG